VPQSGVDHQAGRQVVEAGSIGGAQAKQGHPDQPDDNLLGM
jgi:hypothetical protein